MGDPVNSDDNNGRKPRSIPENTPGFTVAASPLNPVKLELGIILIIGFFLLFIITSVVESQAAQFGYLAAYGFASMLWLVYRVRKLMSQLGS